MIILNDIQEDGNWNGLDPIKQTPNKETGMEFSEHQRIVFEARKVMANFPKRNKKGECNPAELGLWHLGNAYYGGGRVIL
jgi:hypothetical protein